MLIEDVRKCRAVVKRARNKGATEKKEDRRKVVNDSRKEKESEVVKKTGIVVEVIAFKRRVGETTKENNRV